MTTSNPTTKTGRTFLASLLLLGGCAGGEPGSSHPLDLTEVLQSGEARAGQVTDPAALIGGMAAEGRVGDFKLYNDRAVFIVQGLRVGDYYVEEGGGLVDADIVRPEGVPGRDVMDDISTMLGIGRMVTPDSVQVLVSESQGGPVVVRVHGTDTGMGLIEGTAEVRGLIAELGLDVVTDYFLEPDSWTMEVRTTVSATDQAARYRPGDVLFVGPEAADSWTEGGGMEAPTRDPRRWTGAVGKHNEIAIGVLADAGSPHDSSGAELLTELASVGLAFGGEVELEPGESHTWVRHYGVAPDMATLSDAAQRIAGDEVETLQGTVTAPDGPVAGARVVVDVDGLPFTVAFTDDAGQFAADVPSGAQAEALAVGRLTGKILDLPEGASFVGPYIDGPARDLGLHALREGAPPVPAAEGRGVADPSDPLVLSEPAWLEVTAVDGLPFEARLRFTDPDPVPDDDAHYHRRPSGNAMAGWSRDGDLRIPAEAGAYELLVQRGMRWEIHTEAVSLVAGQATQVTVDLGPPIATPGWLLGDPHSHASPSGDGEITMEGRLLASAGNGVQIHFGTDHDHVADYRPTVEAIGLTTLRSVVADEVSPVLRGHMNVYPIEPIPELPNHGALSWWDAFFDNTRAQTDALRERHGEDIIIQSNHPLDKGLFQAADWSPGVIASPDFWSDDIQAIEVDNSGSLDGVPPYFDLVSRGYHVAAVGVTDSHGHFSGGNGRNGTWLPLGDDPRAVTDEALAAAVRAEQTIASRGVFISVSEMPGSTLTGAVSIDAEARSPSWIEVDRLMLMRNGVEVDRVDGTSGTFDLTHDVDCVYNIVAEGDQPMQPLDGDNPWAMTGVYRYDAEGDGWTAPLGELELAR